MPRARLPPTLALLPLLVSVGCGGDGPAGARELFELERMVFVPPKECFLWPSSDLSLHTGILFDCFELTRSDLRHFWPDRVRRADLLEWTTDAAIDEAEHGDWPAFLDFHEAEALAELRAMRLPTPTEWLHVAVGRRSFPTPWGGSGREFFANTVVIQDGKDFSLGRPCNVGTFENGKSRPFGCYDLLGNVWEWVDGVVLGCEPPIVNSTFDERDDGHGTLTSILGGAFDTPWRPTFELDKGENQQRFHARRVDRRTLSPSIGVRMCADAEAYLWSMAPRWGESESARARIWAIGQRWSQDDSARQALRTLLADLRARPGAPYQLAWLEQGVRGDS